MLPLATQNSLLVEWLVPFQTGFPPALFQALSGRTAWHQVFFNLKNPLESLGISCFPLSWPHCSLGSMFLYGNIRKNGFYRFIIAIFLKCCAGEHKPHNQIKSTNQHNQSNHPLNNRGKKQDGAERGRVEVLIRGGRHSGVLSFFTKHRHFVSDEIRYYLHFCRMVLTNCFPDYKL